MIERRHGHIIAINSSAGLMPCADMIPYCAAKFGLKGSNHCGNHSDSLRLKFTETDFGETHITITFHAYSSVKGN